MAILGLEGCILCAGGETGALFGYVGELAVTDNAGIGIGGRELLQQFIHRVLLGLGSGVGSNAFGIETSFIDNTKGA